MLCYCWSFISKNYNHINLDESPQDRSKKYVFDPTQTPINMEDRWLKHWLGWNGGSQNGNLDTHSREILKMPYGSAFR